MYLMGQKNNQKSSLSQQERNYFISARTSRRNWMLMAIPLPFLLQSSPPNLCFPAFHTGEFFFWYMSFCSKTSDKSKSLRYLLDFKLLLIFFADIICFRRPVVFRGILFSEEKTQTNYIENYLNVFPFRSLGWSWFCRKKDGFNYKS